jgi:peptidoglycan/xylan/chitin deacetylase (PgdA/CDA1 family)
VSWSLAGAPGPARDLVGYGPHPPRARWPNGARIALNFVINYEEGSELSHELGDGRTDGLHEIPFALNPKYRDFGTESLFEYGSRAGIWRLARLFEEFDLPVTIYGCAVALERNRDVCAWIGEKDFDICGHGYRWDQVWRLGREEERDRLHKCIQSMQESCGVRPTGWYSRYSPSINTRELLVEEGGFLYDSDAYNDDLPYFVEVAGKRHLIVPYNLTYNDVRMISPNDSMDPETWANFLARAFDYLWEEGAETPRMMTVGLHPRLVGQPGRASGLKQFIDHCVSRGSVWFCRRLDLAQWWLDHHGEFE